MSKEILGTTWTVYDADTLTQAEIYGKVLTDLGKLNPNIVALTADLAKSTKIGKFGDEFPERFFNLGIAEQNLFGVAAGMAKSGLLPVVSTMAAFASMRAAEQVRTDICYQNLNVKIIATHAGLSFGSAGSTHHCTEDLSIMRAFPNMTVIVPAMELKLQMLFVLQSNMKGRFILELVVDLNQLITRPKIMVLRLVKLLNFVKVQI